MFGLCAACQMLMNMTSFMVRVVGVFDAADETTSSKPSQANQTTVGASIWALFNNA
jgi:hypothetical protein